MGCHRPFAGSTVSVNELQPFSQSPIAAPPLRFRHRVRRLGLQAAGRAFSRSSPTTPPRSIVLIRPDHLGDLLFLTPALRALRAALPDARITVLAGPWSAGVIRDNRDLDAVDLCPFPGFERRDPPASGRGHTLWRPLAPYRLLSATARRLRSGAYDTAVVLRFDHWWGAWLAAAAGIPRRIGYDLPETRPFLTEALPYTHNRHEVEQNANLLAALAPGSDWSLGPTRFDVTSEDRAWAKDWLASHDVKAGKPLIAIHPGAGAAVKQWPVAAWAEVACGLCDAVGAHIVLTGSTQERQLAQQISDKTGRPLLDAAGQTSLGQLAALMEQCSLVLGSDCGPLHLAVAVDVPTIHLYGPVSSARFGPWGEGSRHVVLKAAWGCVPCNRLDWPRQALAMHMCLAAIRPGQVLAAAKELLRGDPRL